jgi:4-aminobutyrate aminotransferase/(S)-3-amino-2-methylpropionate transaminase
MLQEGDYATMTAEKGAYFLAGLKELQRRYPHVIGDVDGLGMALRMELCQADGFTPNTAIGKRLLNEAFRGDLEVGGKRYGLVLDVGGYYKNVVVFAPALTITKPEIDLAMKLLDAMLARVTR